MSYQASHLAWQQRVGHENGAYNKYVVAYCVVRRREGSADAGWYRGSTEATEIIIYVP